MFLDWYQNVDSCIMIMVIRKFRKRIFVTRMKLAGRIIGNHKNQQ